MRYRNIYTSVGCNKSCECADWNSGGLIAFGACNSVAVLDTKSNGTFKIIKTFVKHTARVNTVKWIKRQHADHEKEIISGGDDNIAIIWNISSLECRILSGHTGAVNVVATCDINGVLLAITGGSDSIIKLWEICDDRVSCFQKICLNNGCCLSARFSVLPASKQIVLAYSTDSNIHLLYEAFNMRKRYLPLFQLVGHGDWVRGIDIIQHDNSLFLASCSQDTCIRIWKISQYLVNECFDSDNLATKLEDTLNVTQRKTDSVGGNIYKIVATLESVLQGHEDWVYGVHWKERNRIPKLVSTSIDNTTIIWSLNETNVWCDDVRFGELSNDFGGFYGAKFDNNGKSVFAYGADGSLHFWEQITDTIWRPSITVSGHVGAVRDICWEPQGGFIYSTSADRTTRVHSPITLINDGDCNWHEIGKPQTHGYDMQSIAVFSRYKFASGAEEKVIRVFEAPINFVCTFQRLCCNKNDHHSHEILGSMIQGASSSSLSLSNKPIHSDGVVITTNEYKNWLSELGSDICGPERQLKEDLVMRDTLWPETQKLYGHGYEIFALCCSPDGKYLASSSKISGGNDACILIWDALNWKQIDKLAFHELTITQIKFSFNSKLLLAVSRDRRWSLYEKTDHQSSFRLIAMESKLASFHSRVVWSCDWSHDAKYFATASRDGKLAVWAVANYNTKMITPTVADFIEVRDNSIRACAFACNYVNNQEYIIAYGLESGIISIVRFDKVLTSLLSLDSMCSHHLAVKKLKFRPQSSSLQLASCGDDHLVRIYEFYL